MSADVISIFREAASSWSYPSPDVSTEEWLDTVTSKRERCGSQKLYVAMEHGNPEDDGWFMTPDEARKLAGRLLALADQAEEANER